jgi:hypothetical protein
MRTYNIDFINLEGNKKTIPVSANDENEALATFFIENEYIKYVDINEVEDYAELLPEHQTC